jgi:hypothetical protein
MNNRAYLLQIPQPCKEDWQQMMPGQTGRFCAHCSESVVDFTNWSSRARHLCRADEDQAWHRHL